MLLNLKYPKSFMKNFPILGMSIRWFWLGLAVVVLAAASISLLSGSSLRYSDEADYHQLGISILHNHVFADADGKLTGFRPPGYPGLLAVIYSISDSPLAAKLVNVAFLAGALFLLASIARRSHPLAPVFTPYMMVAYPIVLYTSSVLYPQIFGAFLLLIVVWILSQDILTRSAVASAGAVYGLLCLVIPAFILVMPLLFIHQLLVQRGHILPTLKCALIFGASAALLVLPWTARNEIVFGQFVPISTNTGLNLFAGNSALTSANSGVNVDVYSQCEEARNAKDEITNDQALKQCAINWVKSEPGKAARLYFGKVINYFNFRNELATSAEASKWKDWVQFFTYYPLLLAAIVRFGFIRQLPLTRAESLIYILYFGNAFISAIFFTRVRFRIPFDMLLIAVNAAFLGNCWHWFRNRESVNRTV
jgi:hypothetical protein